MKTLFAHRDFRRLVVGQTISALGDWMGTIALMVLVLEITGSSVAVGGILVLRLLPSAVAGPLTTRLVGRWDRKRTMLAMDFLRAGMALLLPIIGTLWWVYLWAFAIEVAGLVFLPARDAAIPALLRPEGSRDDRPSGGDGDLALANGIVLGTSYGTIPFGAGLFGLVLLAAQAVGLSGTTAYIPVFWLDAATYLASYSAVARIATLGGGAEPGGQERSEPRGFLASLRTPLVRTVLPVALTITIGVGALFSLGVTFVREVLGAGPVQFGVLIACFGAGAAGGLALVRKLRRPDPLTQVRDGVVVIGVVVAAMSLLGSLILSFLGAAIFGAAAAGTLTRGMTLIQDTLSGDARTLAFAAFHVTIRGGLAGAALLAGAAADLAPTLRLPLVGSLQPAQTVLAAAGLLVLASAALVRGVAPVTDKPAPAP